MATMFYDDAADLAVIRGKKVAILGYGSQGHAHALNLKDSGVDVRVGLSAASRSREKARAAGLIVGEVADAVKSADIVMMLMPDEHIAGVYNEFVAPNLKKGGALAFATDLLLAGRPTRTSTPLSFRFSACAWPCEPYPMTATFFAWISDRSASLS